MAGRLAVLAAHGRCRSVPLSFLQIGYGTVVSLSFSAWDYDSITSNDGLGGCQL